MAYTLVGLTFSKSSLAESKNVLYLNSNVTIHYLGGTDQIHLRDTLGSVIRLHPAKNIPRLPKVFFSDLTAVHSCHNTHNFTDCDGLNVDLAHRYTTISEPSPALESQLWLWCHSR